MINKQAYGSDQLAFYACFALITICCLLGAAYWQQYLLVLPPFLIALAYTSVINFKTVFYLLLFFLPLSIEYYFQGSNLATDLPTEPLMIGLMIVFFLYIFVKPNQIDSRFVLHPLILILGIHFFWTFLTALNSENIFISMKFFFAKTWYIVVFVFLAGLIIKDSKTFKTAFWVIFIPLLTITLLTLGRQAMQNFTFANVNETVMPYFRNHVNYAAHLTIMLPFIWIAADWYQKGTFKRRLLLLSRIIFLVAIYFSYTRACWAAILVAALAYVLLNRGWLPHAAIIGLLIAGGFFGYMSYKNYFMHFAPNYRNTITFESFDRHLQATYELKDASTMERIYRWIAALNMMDKNTWLGYGPGNFYPHYKKYTLSSFRTYISDNEEQSTVHNYFLLMLVEQGIIGMMIFIALTISLFVYGQRVFKQIIERQDRLLASAAILSLVVLFVNLMLSDLVEAVKTGTIFFLNIAILVNLDIKYRRNQDEQSPNETAKVS